ncbi:SprT-like domain-containing protein [Aquimarina agarivorans]|uniref:SprT-like domain-containing protein n=1 Tax=Aquimarina agarivorans TaxID=980584 RepID=UPI000248EB92|nr:SprT-like domain-containing protein [Aquimarina agarivorans]
MKSILKKYLPERAVDPVFELIKVNNVYLKIVNQRQTKHGDYRKLPSGEHVITINNTLNKYRFLVTLVHEIAHLVAFTKYGRLIKPHGKEWKYTFQQLMLPFIRPEVFPTAILPVVANHFRNPKASSDTDAQFSIALKQFDENDDSKCYVYQLLPGAVFRFRGRTFKVLSKKIKRYVCAEVGTGREFLFQPNAEVEKL